MRTVELNNEELELLIIGLTTIIYENKIKILSSKLTSYSEDEIENYKNLLKKFEKL